MKRFHIHVSVDDLTQSVRFYSTLFARQPLLVEADYAKWMLEDPPINFAISNHHQPVGLNHLGFQVDSTGNYRRCVANSWRQTLAWFRRTIRPVATHARISIG
jgi:hypothetical protein